MTDDTPTRAEITEDWCEGDEAMKAHLDSLSEKSFRTLLTIALHRKYPKLVPHPGYDGGPVDLSALEAYVSERKMAGD